MSRSDIGARAAALTAERVPFVHARVVRAERPTSAKPGDQAIIFGDGTMEGFVGGSCAESTVRAQSLALLDSGEPLLLRISPSPEAPSPGNAGPVDGVLSVHNPCLSGGSLEIFLEPVVPAPLVLVHGESPIAHALVAVGSGLGYDVTPYDEGSGADVDGGATLPLAGAAAVVVASHGRGEEEVLLAALAAGVPYVGLVASRRRGEAVLAALDLQSAGIDDTDRERVHSPAGLDIGARTAAEVALSILAQIVGERRQPSGRAVTPSSQAVTAVGQSAQPVEPARASVAIDPVCGMTVAAVDSSLHLDYAGGDDAGGGVHAGSRHYFCGSGCLRAFAADPAGYARA